MTNDDEDLAEHKKHCFTCALYDFMEKWVASYPKGRSPEEKESDTGKTELSIGLLQCSMKITVEALKEQYPNVETLHPDLKDAMLIGGYFSTITTLVGYMRAQRQATAQLQSLFDAFHNAEMPSHRKH